MDIGTIKEIGDRKVKTPPMRETPAPAAPTRAPAREKEKA